MPDYQVVTESRGKAIKGRKAEKVERVEGQKARKEKFENRIK